jgi:hypothetical protein
LFRSDWNFPADAFDPPGFDWKKNGRSERRADFSQLGENRRLGQPDLVKLGNDGLGIAGRT